MFSLLLQSENRVTSNTKTLNPMATKPLPFFFIGKETTEKRKKKFIETKHDKLSNALRKEDTKSIWYSRDHISKLLEEIDHANGDGLRLYFGAYEDGHEFAGQLCLVMNVTRGSRDVILEKEADFPERSKSEKSFDPNAKLISKDFNFGSPCPPRCDGVS
jgi:hypothetical protein